MPTLSEETTKSLNCKNRFFDKVPDTRVIINLDYEINQFSKCLESEGVPVNEHEAAQLLDVYIRAICGIINLAPIAENINVIKHLNIVVGDLDFHEVADEDINKMIEIVSAINRYSFVKFNSNTLENINSHIKIVFKECSTFIREFKNILTKMHIEYGLSDIIGIIEMDSRCFRIKLSSKYPDNFISTDNNAFNIESNMISYPRFFREPVKVVATTFNPDDKKFKEFIEKIDKANNEFKKD